MEGGCIWRWEGNDASSCPWYEDLHSLKGTFLAHRRSVSCGGQFLHISIRLPLHCSDGFGIMCAMKTVLNSVAQDACIMRVGCVARKCGERKEMKKLLIMTCAIASAIACVAADQSLTWTAGANPQSLGANGETWTGDLVVKNFTEDSLRIGTTSDGLNADQKNRIFWYDAQKSKNRRLYIKGNGYLTALKGTVISLH